MVSSCCFVTSQSLGSRNNMDFSEKSESLAQKMNSITSKFTENLDVADDLIVDGDDIVEFVEEKTQDIELLDECSPSEIINLKNMVSDFTFVRSTLKENTENARKVLNSVTLDLLSSDDDKRANLIMSFAELNKAVADNMKLYITAYKEISGVLLNLEKIKGSASPKVVNNTVIHGEIKSTTDIIRELGKNAE